jgi:hypothetical protein
LLVSSLFRSLASTGVSNAEELIFDTIDFGYLVSVATLEGSGRSSTAQMLHASEAAFLDALQEQMAALMQTIPDIDGTEIIIETTGDQFGDEFHRLWRRTQAGENEFKAIFLPWSIDPDVPNQIARRLHPDHRGKADCGVARFGRGADVLASKQNRTTRIGRLFQTQ